MKYAAVIFLALAVMATEPAFAALPDIMSFDTDHDRMLSDSEMKAYLAARCPKGMSLEDADKYFRERATQI